MKKIFLIVLFAHCFILVIGQKKLLDHSEAAWWPMLNPRKISDNGKYVSYSLWSRNTGDTLVVKATDHSWERKLPKVSDASFTEDSRFLIFSRPTDTMGIMELGKEDLHYFPLIRSFKLPKEGGGEWLAYQVKDQKKSLVIRNLHTGTEKKYNGVNDYIFNDSGNAILLDLRWQKDNSSVNAILLVDLRNDHEISISRGYKGSNFVFDRSGSKLAFLAEDSIHGHLVNTIRYFAAGFDSAKVIVNNSTSGMSGMTISNKRFFFSNDGNRLFFFIQDSLNAPKVKASDSVVHVDVWNYKDEALQEEQLSHIKWGVDRTNYAAVISVKSDGTMIRLQDKGDDIGFFKLADGGNENYSLIERRETGGHGAYFPLTDIWLVSIRDGKRTLLKGKVRLHSLGLSSKGRYVIWFDIALKSWFTYNVSNAAITNISKKIGVHLHDDEEDHAHPPGDFGIAAWLKDDQAVLLYDRYDLWRVDPDGEKDPINITGGYGRKNKITFRYAEFNNEAAGGIDPHRSVLLSAFNYTNKYSGFFRQKLDVADSPEQLTMGPFAYYFYPADEDFAQNQLKMLPLKASHADTYILHRMNAETFPNLLVTKDFKDFEKISNLEPQANYNWYRTELRHWKLLDGKTGEGILYKPENFNPRKKYPIIFYYYEQLSNCLNFFIGPELSAGYLPIPWFVSNGYLVFVPDIHYKIGYPGESAYNSVVSAAAYLSKMPWIDSRRMGIQGHSYGGFETDYIVTRTNIFAAAAPSSAPTEMISLYDGVTNGKSMHMFYEGGQGRLGATLWEKPELYIKNSPIFNADKVTTPLLIMHNKDDDLITWQSQGVGWFTALQSLGKKAWMLQYDGENHIILKQKNALDYSIRLGQFFDHYLKGAPPPRWMTTGVPAGLKGIDTGLELDTSGKMP